MEKNDVCKQGKIILIFVLSMFFIANNIFVAVSDQIAMGQEEDAENYAPIHDIPDPVSGSSNMPLSFSWSIPIEDYDGDRFDWFITCTNGQVKSGFDDVDGTKTIDLINLDYDTTYYIWVNASDGQASSNVQYRFSTRPTYLPEKPTDFDSLTATETTIELTWMMGENADRTYIEWNVVPGWTRGLGTMIYNGSGSSYIQSNVVAHRRYFYQAWGWNETDQVYSDDYAKSDAYRFGYIPEDGNASPIRKYFTTQKILWTFDDYQISANHHPPHLGFTVIPEVVVGYGGHVNIMTILFGPQETDEIRNYSVVDELGWSQERINKSLEYFSNENIYPACHGWDYRPQPLNTATLEYAYNIINHTLWNWKNNFDIQPHFFLGGSTSGNYNITVALKKFSETYWPVYGENFRWQENDKFPITSRDAPAVEFIDKYDYVELFDPLFGCDWGDPCTTVDEAKNMYNERTQNKEIIFIRGHPKKLDGSDPSVVENISLWKNWIDWIYQNHELININHTQAIEYNVDRYSFKVYKNSVRNYTIDLTDCTYDHDMIFSQPYKNLKSNWEIIDESGSLIGEVFDDETYTMYAGNMYYFISDDEALDDLDTTTTDTPGFAFVSTLIALIGVSILLKKRR